MLQTFDIRDQMIDPFQYVLGSICFMFWSQIFVLFEPYIRFHSFSSGN